MNGFLHCEMKGKYLCTGFVGGTILVGGWTKPLGSVFSCLTDRMGSPASHCSPHVQSIWWCIGEQCCFFWILSMGAREGADIAHNRAHCIWYFSSSQSPSSARSSGDPFSSSPLLCGLNGSALGFLPALGILNLPPAIRHSIFSLPY